MPSPFPGMDPYLEDPALWPGVHQSLITYIRDVLQPRIRPDYHARIGERLYIVEPYHSIYPDITLTRQPAPAAAAPTDVAAPVLFTVPPVEHREPFIEIIHTAGHEVVTVIEILSPANKTPGDGHRLYRQKQAEILRSQAHLVEIDLLSKGRHTIAIPEDSLPELPPHRYLISVSRAFNRFQFEIYPILLSNPLPAFLIPLKAPDPDVALDLQAVFEQCYENGGYVDFVDYSQPPSAPLSEEEGEWVEEVLGVSTSPVHGTG